MYSYEIERLLKIKQNIITSSEYLEILSTSPQIDHVKYNPYEDKIEMNTNDGYNFKVKVKIKGTGN